MQLDRNDTRQDLLCIIKDQVHVGVLVTLNWVFRLRGGTLISLEISRQILVFLATRSSRLKYSGSANYISGISLFFEKGSDLKVKSRDTFNQRKEVEIFETCSAGVLIRIKGVLSNRM